MSAEDQDAFERLLEVAGDGQARSGQAVASAGFTPSAHGRVKLKSPNFLSKKERARLAHWTTFAGLVVLASSIGLGWAAWARDGDEFSGNVVWMAAASLLAGFLLLLLSLVVVNGYGNVELSGGTGDEDGTNGSATHDRSTTAGGQKTQLPPTTPVPEAQGGSQ